MSVYVVLCCVVWLTRLRTILASSSAEFIGMRSARFAVAGESLVLELQDNSGLFFFSPDSLRK